MFLTSDQSEGRWAEDEIPDGTDQTGGRREKTA